MKSKALVLGAHPPFEGPWVSLEGAEKWEVVVEGTKDASTISFSTRGGENDKDLCLFGKNVRAEAVRICLQPIDGTVGPVTAHVESVEE